MTDQECAIFLCGVIRGLLSFQNRKLGDEPAIAAALKQLGCPNKYLPAEEPQPPPAMGEK